MPRNQTLKSKPEGIREGRPREKGDLIMLMNELKVPLSSQGPSTTNIWSYWYMSLSVVYIPVHTDHQDVLLTYGRPYREFKAV